MNHFESWLNSAILWFSGNKLYYKPWVDELGMDQ